MNAQTLSLLISAACTVAGLVSGLAPAHAEAATAARPATAAHAPRGSVTELPAAMRLAARG